MNVGQIFVNRESLWLSTWPSRCYFVWICRIYFR